MSIQKKNRKARQENAIIANMNRCYPIICAFCVKPLYLCGIQKMLFGGELFINSNSLFAIEHIKSHFYKL